MKKSPADKLVKAAQAEIERQQRLIRWAQEVFNLGLILQAFPEARFSWSWSSYLCVDLPARFELVSEVKEFVKLQYPNWKIYYEHQIIWEDQKAGGIFLQYQVPTGVKYEMAEIHFDFRTSTQGSTCVMHRIGSKRKTVPIFEITCQQAIEEGSF